MDDNLKQLLSNNPEAKIAEETEHINIRNLWNDQTFMCRFEKSKDFSSLANAIFPKELSAIYHPNENKLELIFTPLEEDDETINRIFTFFYQGEEFKCSFREPSSTLVLIANGFRETKPSSQTDYRNLRKYRDYYKQEDLPGYVKKYFENRIPINFFIEGDFNKIKLDFTSLSKHLNFYMSYYDRLSPVILLFEPESDSPEYKLPCFTIKEQFPQNINIKQLDPVLLDLFNVASRTGNIRLKFIFYYQVLEYCSYYYLNDDLRKKLSNIIKRPDILNKVDEYGKLMIEEFKDYFRQNDDSAKLEKVISEHVNYSDIRIELECHKDYFSKPLEFDGGFKLNPIISDKEDFDSPHPAIMKSVKTNIEKIRNVIVHIRESRENKVILPTTKNSNLLVPYLHLIQRLAEIVSIQYE